MPSRSLKMFLAIIPAVALLAFAGGILVTETGWTQQARSTIVSAVREPGDNKAHKLVLQVNENKPEIMNLALNNAQNVIEHYKKLGETTQVEIVTFGPGLHMLRDDTSPVKARIQQMSLENPALAFIACANTQERQSKAEQKPITLIAEAKVQPSGVVRLMELQSKGYAYIRP